MIIDFALSVVAVLGLLVIVVGAVVLIAFIVIQARPADAPMLSLLTGEPVDTGAPAPIYPIEIARRRRDNTFDGAA